MKLHENRRKVRLGKFSNKGYDPVAGGIKRRLWYIVNSLFFQSYFFPFNFLKIFLLRIFGAHVGKGAVIKPSVNIKYPWLLEIGEHVWVGEKVWIDNLVQVRIDSDVCLSQGAMLLTGSHDYKKESFDLLTGEIHLEEGVWIGARSVVCPGVTCGSHCVLAVQSVLAQDACAYGVYQGNPAELKRMRRIKA
ncbi:MAG: WcaF family extracellular polysaccharide biosynthesis acetyltransferase [Cytophagales bacterium]|nr:WcaF family extracellular polysaccharide biosynthesis acetyltransferase [Cytophagales bacterium]